MHLSFSKNRVLWRIFCPKRNEMVGGYRRLYNEELRNFYASPNIIRMIIWRRMRWYGHEKCMKNVLGKLQEEITMEI